MAMFCHHLAKVLCPIDYVIRHWANWCNGRAMEKRAVGAIVFLNDDL
jgi:hypothetical protein